MARRIVLYIVLAVAASWPLDLLVWHVRSAPTAQVTVEQFMSTPLKGQREEYDYLGATQVVCSQSLYPHGGMSTCWYVRRHASKWTALPRP